jgi:hypothetical protein
MCFDSPDPLPPAPSAKQLAKKEAERQALETRKRIIENATDADTMRGRRGNIATTPTGDPAYGAMIETTSPVSLTGLPLGRTKLGK